MILIPIKKVLNNFLWKSRIVFNKKATYCTFLLPPKDYTVLNRIKKFMSLLIWTRWMPWSMSWTFWTRKKMLRSLLNMSSNLQNTLKNSSKTIFIMSKERNLKNKFHYLIRAIIFQMKQEIYSIKNCLKKSLLKCKSIYTNSLKWMSSKKMLNFMTNRIFNFNFIILRRN